MDIKIKFLPLVFLLVSISCNRETKDYKFKYSMEITGNYKAVLSVNSKDRSYQFEEYNFYFDKLEGVKKPILLSGQLSPEDYNLLTKTIANSRITKLKDDYGFSGNNNITGKILHNLSYISGKTEKFIVIRGIADPKEITPEVSILLNHCNKLMTHLKNNSSLKEDAKRLTAY